MTIDEAIQKMREEAKRQRYNASFDKGGIYHQLCLCALQNAKEYDQIAEMLEHFKEYQQFKLPCNVGDTVYKVNKASKKVSQHKVIKFEIEKEDLYYTMQIWFENFDYCFLHHFGEIVFLTKSEAEAKLKELEWCATCRAKDDCDVKESFLGSDDDSCAEYA